MTHRFATNYAKNYCNRTPIVKVIAENVVTFFWGGDIVYIYQWAKFQTKRIQNFFTHAYMYIPFRPKNIVSYRIVSRKKGMKNPDDGTT